ncbi:MAG: hypothetical protein ACYTEQ_16375, partial [Planctomycetota bacterium]
MKTLIQVNLVLVLFAMLFAQAAAQAAPTRHVPNEIIIKFRETAADKVERELQLGKSARELRLSEKLDQLSARYRVKAIKPVFENFKKNRQRLQTLLHKDKALLTKKEKHIRRRLNRAPKGAAVPDLDRIYRIQLDLGPGRSLQEAVNAYNRDADVEYAELNHIVSACKTPCDSLYPVQWALNNTGQDYPISAFDFRHGTAGCDINAPEAWDVNTGSSQVVVAVIDTGVDYGHRDLAWNIWSNEDEIFGNGIDDDGNGYVDDIV